MSEKVCRPEEIIGTLWAAEVLLSQDMDVHEVNRSQCQIWDSHTRCGAKSGAGQH